MVHHRLDTYNILQLSKPRHSLNSNFSMSATVSHSPSTSDVSSAILSVMERHRFVNFSSRVCFVGHIHPTCPESVQKREKRITVKTKGTRRSNTNNHNPIISPSWYQMFITNIIQYHHGATCFLNFVDLMGCFSNNPAPQHSPLSQTST